MGTVSRILNGSTEVSARAASRDTAERVRHIAREMAYTPDLIGRSLRTQRTQLFGVLVPRMTDVVFALVHEGIEDAAAAHGYYTYTATTRDDTDEQRVRIEMMLSQRVTGLIFGDAHHGSSPIDEVAALGIPFVLINRRSGDHPSVTCDDYEGGRLVAQHLLSLGHERVAVVAGELFSSTDIDRTRGFLDTYRQEGVRVPHENIVNGRVDSSGGNAAGRQLLDFDPRLTAIFAVNDFAAVGVMGAARERGMRVGTDLSVVGFNDVPLAKQLPLPLTTVRSSLYEMGTRAVQMLIQILAGEKVQQELLLPTLQVRESSGPAMTQR